MGSVWFKEVVYLVLLLGVGNCLLFHDDNYPTTPTPLGLEATVSLLVQDISRLNSDMRSQETKLKEQEKKLTDQENEIASLKNQLNICNMTTKSKEQILRNELASINSTISSLKTDIDVINHSMGTQVILEKVNNIAQSVRYLTLSLHDQETKVESNNRSLHQEVEQLKTQFEHISLDIVALNSTEISSVAHLQSQITGVKSSVTGLQSKTSSLQSQVNSLQSTSSSLQTKTSQLSSDVSSLETHFFEYFKYIVSFKSLRYTNIRLVGGNSTAGRVEVEVNGVVWGTVCDDSFDQNENAAKVVCRSLNKPWQNAVHTSMFHAGDTTQLIWLDEVHCSGSEGNINACSHSSLGVHNCFHFEDVGVICK